MMHRVYGNQAKRVSRSGSSTLKQRSRVRQRAADRRRCAFTILELLTVMGIVSVLVAVILPAVVAARGSARRMQCSNHLKQLGLAIHSYHDLHGSLPQGCQMEASNRSGYGWCVPLLPFLEQSAVYRRTDRNRVIEDPVNASARDATLAQLLCPSDITQPRFLLFADDQFFASSAAAIVEPVPLVELPTANYVGVFGTVEPDDRVPAPEGDGAFLHHRTVRFAELRRGLSNTIIVGERTMKRVPSTWLGVDIRGEDAACRLVGAVMTAPNCSDCDECEFGSRHPNGANFLWADGHVSLLSADISRDEYQRLARRADF